MSYCPYFFVAPMLAWRAHSLRGNIMSRSENKKGKASRRKTSKAAQPFFPADEQPRPKTHTRDEVRRVTTHRQGHPK
jgi:hypothetical protein